VRTAPLRFDFQIEQKLACVIFVAEARVRRPLQVVMGRQPEIAAEYELSVPFAHMQLVLVGVENFDPILGAFGERHAVPGVFMGAVFARFGLARPAGHFELCPARVELRIHQAEFYFLHRRSCSDWIKLSLARARSRPAGKSSQGTAKDKKFESGPERRLLRDSDASGIRVCVQPVSATPLAVYRLAFGSPRSFADVD
jgi:hypothetical protein